MKRISLLLLCLAGCLTNNDLKKMAEDGTRMRFDLARTFVKKGAYVAALPLVQKAAEERPDDPEVRMLHATVLRERSLYAQAEREYLAAVGTAPTYGAAWDGLGILYDLMKRPADAVRAHGKAIESAPKEGRFWNNLGFSYYINGKDDEAIAAFEHALGLDPSLVISYNNLGFTYARKKDFENARRCFQAALGDVSGNLNLALAYEQSGDNATAAELRQEARRHMPYGEERP